MSDRKGWRSLEVASTILAIVGVIVVFFSVGLVATSLFSSVQAFLTGCVVFSLGVVGIICSRQVISGGQWTWRASSLWCGTVLFLSCWMLVDALRNFDETSFVAIILAFSLFLLVAWCLLALLRPIAGGRPIKGDETNQR
ncbi:membrane protein [Rhodopirellula maiorica SM1]|uniref:Membrane protein n=1 Tax=Rhodopirellula maiorica SM1 TaxID=1265738 RepID=M5RPP3_9BACT|nr:membrane protein [Rhodopirellula maiorica SM1]